MIFIYILFIFLILYIWRVFKGPTLWDRLLGLNLISSKILVIIILFASFSGLPFLVDIAIVCALLGFIGIIFTSLFLQERLKDELEYKNKPEKGEEDE